MRGPGFRVFVLGLEGDGEIVARAQGRAMLRPQVALAILDDGAPDFFLLGEVPLVMQDEGD